MTMPVLPDIQALANRTQDDDTVSPGALQRLWARSVESLADPDADVSALLTRADEYQASAPGFADELRLAAAAGVPTDRAVAA